MLAFMLNCTFSTDPAAPVAAAAVASGRPEICAASRPSLPAGTDMECGGAGRSPTRESGGQRSGGRGGSVRVGVVWMAPPMCHCG